MPLENFSSASFDDGLSASTDTISKQKFRILSIDGGGVRGIIPARILQEIEARVGKRIYELFDLIIGNSTGGLVALALMTPNQKGSAKYQARDLVDFYQKYSTKIFYSPLWRKAITGGGLWGAKYSRKNFDQILDQFFGDIRLSQTLKPVIIPSYSLDQGLPHLWTTHLALEEKNKDDPFLKDIAGATSAAPTYFPPKVIKTSTGKLFHEADGGLWANNPESIAIWELGRLGLDRNDVLMVSVGTGKVKLDKPIEKLKEAGVIGWVLRANLIDVIMSAESNWSQSAVSALFPVNHRIQIDLPKDLGKMDNASNKNLQGLVATTEQYIQTNTSSLNKLCDALRDKVGVVA